MWRVMKSISLRGTLLRVLALGGLLGAGWAVSCNADDLRSVAQTTAWAPSEKLCALAESSGRLKVWDVGTVQRPKILWSGSLAEVDAEGLDEGTARMAFSPDSRFLTAAYVSKRGNLTVRVFAVGSGSPVQCFSVVLPKNRQCERLLIKAVRMGWERSGRFMYLWYFPFDHQGRLILLDTGSWSVVKQVGSVTNVAWVGDSLLWSQGDENLYARRFFRLGTDGITRPARLRYERAKIQHWVTDGKCDVFLLQASAHHWETKSPQRQVNGSVTSTLSAYDFSGKSARRLWRRSWKTDRFDSGEDTLTSLGNGWVAAALPFGTDGVSCQSIWCWSKSGRILPEEIYDGSREGRYLIDAEVMAVKPRKVAFSNWTVTTSGDSPTKIYTSVDLVKRRRTVVKREAGDKEVTEITSPSWTRSFRVVEGASGVELREGKEWGW